jgi:hypothetical protein
MNACTCTPEPPILWEIAAVCAACGGVYGADHPARHDLLLLRSVAPAVLSPDAAVSVLTACLHLDQITPPPPGARGRIAADARELLGLFGDSASLSGLSAATLGLAAALPPREVLAAVYLWADHGDAAPNSGSMPTVEDRGSSTVRTYEVAAAALLLALSSPVDSALDRIATPIARVLAGRCAGLVMTTPMRVSVYGLRRALDNDPLRAEMAVAECGPGQNTTVSILGHTLAHRRLGNRVEAAAFHHLLVGSGCFSDAFSYGACAGTMWGLDATGPDPNVTSTVDAGSQ